MQDDGRFSISTRLLLNTAQRDRLLALCQQEQVEVAELITRIVGEYLNARADVVRSDGGEAKTLDYALLERNLRQLRIQARQLGPEVPQWLQTYIADLERELGRGQ